jgi:hypothetical protein
MIAGRSTALWAGLIGAVLNLLALGWVAFSGQEMTQEMAAFFAAANSLALAIIALLANQSATGTWIGRAP